jgi:ATP-binding cassette subfamily C (CFTR/MRP) protein 1
MDAGNVMYFGPWNPQAQETLSKYLPTAHLLAAAGGAEQPREKPKKKAVVEEKKKAEEPEVKKVKENSASLPLKAAIWEYCFEARWWLFYLSLITFLACQTSRQMADFFIRWWISDTYGSYKGKCTTELCYGNYYASFYAILTGIFVSSMFLRGALLYLWALGASSRIYSKSVHRVLYAPLGFFFFTPVGDLLVSFSKDQDTMDEALPDAIYYAGIYGLILVATTITVSVTIVLFAPLAGALFLVSGLMLSIYLPAATHLKKLRMAAAGDLVTLVSESLDGLVVIQAYSKQAYFTKVTSDYIDLATRTVFGEECLNLWLAFYCDFFGASLVLAVASLGVGQWSTLGSSAVGLAFSQSIQMLVFYTWSIRLLADSVGLFGSVEKLAYLANHAPQEGGRLAPPSADNSKMTSDLNTKGIDLPDPEVSHSSPLCPLVLLVAFLFLLSFFLSISQPTLELEIAKS